MQRLRALLSESDQNRGRWTKGYKPIHYKRLSISEEEADRLALFGQEEILTCYEEPILAYYTQSLIAGAMISREYDTLAVITPSQYGKSWLLGHVAPIMAFYGQKLSVAGATASVTDIIMTYVRQSVRGAEGVIKDAISGETMRKIDRLDASLSKTRVSFAKGGYIEALTLGDTYEDIGHNKAVGRGTGYIIDEAALVSDQALAEVGRREFASTEGKKELLVMISNPHKPGAFYDAMVGEPDDRTLIIWMDALTACQEGRWTPETVLKSNFAQRAETRTKYLLCELPTEGIGLFPAPLVGKPFDGLHVLGVDAAYKGKDNIELCDLVISNGRLYVAEIATLKKNNWIDGVTSTDITRDITRVYRSIGAALICVDVGYGVWLVEGLAKNGCDVRGINFGAGPEKDRIRARHYAATNASNMRAEMHLDLADLMEERRITWSEDAARGVKDILPYVTSERKTSGKIQIRPKAVIKGIIGHSPDKLDAVLLAVHAAILMMG